MVNVYLLQKLAESEAFAGNPKEAEKILHNIITEVKSLTSDKSHVFEHYSNLMAHCMKYNQYAKPRALWGQYWRAPN